MRNVFDKEVREKQEPVARRIMDVNRASKSVFEKPSHEQSRDGDGAVFRLFWGPRTPANALKNTLFKHALRTIEWEQNSLPRDCKLSVSGL